ncbi:hypothetical protein C9I98_26215 [Photobacterium sanctipauli]|uniref:DUF4145 domain-containing protein n=1 Tax=Photobacterium sanctipauli TaxID=1342794 RepID=A0A2T3N7H4_9GAMM|nr:hypothetical protein [Photobacterium sanctipauli]PSW08903.1 hypothetical protein C9I98_26215 [Photobacterium sanctipauli]
MKTYSKSQLALIQLEKAIALFFEEQDYVCCITLAGASEEITRKILERDSKKPVAEKLQGWFKDKYPDAPENSNFYAHANRTRNSLKHFDNLNESEVEINEAEAAYWLCRAFMNYEMSHAILTEPLIRFMGWMVENGKNGQLQAIT